MPTSGMYPPVKRSGPSTVPWKTPSIGRVTFGGPVVGGRPWSRLGMRQLLDEGRDVMKSENRRHVAGSCGDIVLVLQGNVHKSI